MSSVLPSEIPSPPPAVTTPQQVQCLNELERYAALMAEQEEREPSTAAPSVRSALGDAVFAGSQGTEQEDMDLDRHKRHAQRRTVRASRSGPRRSEGRFAGVGTTSAVHSGEYRQRADSCSPDPARSATVGGGEHDCSGGRNRGPSTTTADSEAMGRPNVVGQGQTRSSLGHPGGSLSRQRQLRAPRAGQSNGPPHSSAGGQPGHPASGLPVHHLHADQGSGQGLVNHSFAVQGCSSVAQAEEAAPATLTQPLRTILFHCFLTSLRSRLQEMEENQELLLKAKELGLIKRSPTCTSPGARRRRSTSRTPWTRSVTSMP